MGTKHLHRCLVVVVAIGLRGARGWRRTCAPKLCVVVHAVVSVAGGDGEHARALAAHVAAAAAATAALSIAAALSSGPAAQLLEATRIVAIAALAVSAALVLVGRARGSARRGAVRPLILATARRVDSLAAPLPAAFALQLACEPRLLWASAQPIRLALHHAARQVVSRATTNPWTSVPALISPALSLLGTCRSTLDSARFVRQFALTAVELSAEPSLLALS